MLNGIPVVGSDIEPIRALLGPQTGGDDAGVLVPAGDPVAAAEAVTALAGDAGFRRRLGESGRRRAAAFDPASVAAALTDLYGLAPTRAGNGHGRTATEPGPAPL
jgi:glycosyltransferase involved in cell wall biosynthesis